MTLRPVILSGGSGTRLWPVSRQAYPKQFLSLTSSQTMLQETLSRLEGTPDLGDSLVVGNEDHRFLIAEQLRLIGQESETILLEPMGRNTAPALTMAALHALAYGDDPLLLVAPADHHIANEDAFRAAIEVARTLAEEGRLVTFGIVPTHAETGYGYIRQGNAIHDQAYVLDQFVEKPDEATAQRYVDSGDFLWNSGIFLMKASVWMEQIQVHRPDIAEACQRAHEAIDEDGLFRHIPKAEFAACPSDSIDYAVMEKVSGDSGMAAVVPLDAQWNDVGSWSALLDVKEKDEQGNVAEGDAYLDDVENSMVMSGHRYVAAIGVKDLVIVETPDCVLVADKNRAQDVKAVTEALKQDERSEHVTHTKVQRPWGAYECIDEGTRFQVKRLSVKPGERLSLQLHHHRAEHWIVVHGTAQVTRGEDTFILSENESTYIPLGVKHRLENPGSIPLEIIEVQSGTYLGEDDIVRFEDVYRRV